MSIPVPPGYAADTSYAAAFEFADEFKPLQKVIEQTELELGDAGSVDAVEDWARDTAESLRSAGFDLNLFPVADIATLGMVRNLITFYGARELVGFDQYTHVDAWLQRGLARPAVQRGLLIPSR